MRILLVDSDSGRATALGEALTAAGAELTLAASGSFALTMLEWDRHDVVVSRARLGDMEGRELCAILRDDPGLKELRFVLVARPEEVGASAGSPGIDLILPSTMSAAMMLARITRLVPDAPADPGPGELPQSFAGSLDGIELGKLARVIAAAGRTGHLLIAFEGAGGAVAFEAGRVVHAEFGEETGRSAFASLMSAARRAPAGEFCFVADDSGALHGTPRTVHTDIDDLLRGS